MIQENNAPVVLPYLSRNKTPLFSYSLLSIRQVEELAWPPTAESLEFINVPNEHD